MASVEFEHVGPELSPSARPSMILTEAKDDISCQKYGEMPLTQFEMLLEIPDMDHCSVSGCASHASGWQRKGNEKVRHLCPFPQRKSPWMPKEGCGGLTFANIQIPTQLLTPSSLPSFSCRMQKKNRMRKITGQDKNRDSACQLLLWAKQTT